MKSKNVQKNNIFYNFIKLMYSISFIIMQGCGALYIKEKYFKSSLEIENSVSILGKCFKYSIGLVIIIVVIHLLVIIVVSIFRTRDYE